MNVSEINGRWDYGTLPKNVRIGDGCWFERRESFARFRSERDPGLVIGPRVRLFNWTTLNVEPSGYLEIGEDSTLVGAIFMCAGEIRIGRGVIASYHVTIADSDFHPRDVEARKRDAVANSPSGDKSRRPSFVSKPVVIEDGVWIGIGAIVLKGVRVGAGARIGPGAVVTADVAPGAWVAGNPARAVSASEAPWIHG